MDHKSKVRQIALAALVTAGGIQAGCAQTPPDTTPAAAVPTVPASAPSTASAPAVAQTPAVSQAVTQSDQTQTTALTPEEAGQSAVGNVAELQQRIHDGDLSELRTTYNGSYGASLLFYAKDMTYYVALFQQKNFWRVIKTGDEARAEAIYRDFARQTVQLSDVEIRRTQLQAQKAFTERMIALSQDHASRLQADLTIARHQQSVVADQQKTTRDEANSLQAQRAAAEDQLRELQRQIQVLQQQVEGGLPVR
ncbi:hypothetical protein CY652_01835 [Burkholderia sp. WAC0059]|uniref:DUF2968 domain-containing protein n=1 Tax=Burkholderia sp. WAC0059 TaxID=2066022 RepID=UPI000C7F4BD7|nr:DUF2968 domain-containing protein [Burkholderia sp. WAC0059]PLZ04426.1 hypothetical protein CY652_01835 [Burkholderia sp. WAC0059]